MKTDLHAKVVEGMDDLPSLMRKLSKAPASPKRYSVCGPNTSFEMGKIMEDPETRKKNGGSDKNIQRRIREQAQKITEHLSRLDTNSRNNTVGMKPERNTQELANKAIKSLTKSLKGRNSSIKSVEELFWNYDQKKTGVVNYDDLGQILLSVGSTLDKNESYMLAHTLDAKKTGMLNYSDIISHLKKLEEHDKTTNPAPSSSSSSSSSSLEKLRDGKKSVKIVTTDKSVSSTKKKSKKKRSLRNHLERIASEEKENIGKQKKNVANDSIKKDAAKYMKTVKKRKQSKDLIRSKMLENSVVVQLQGKFGGLRHALRCQDVSRSGVVNKAEFMQSLRSSGVILTDAQLNEMFAKHASTCGTEEAMGLTQGQGVNVEDFVHKMRQRASSSAFSHLSKLARVDQAKRREEMRVMKKVLDTLGSQERAATVFTDMMEENKDWVEPTALMDGLNRLGANVTEEEFTMLVEMVDENKDGKIELKEFDDYLTHAVSEATELETREKRDNLIAHGRYSRTFMSNEMLYSHLQPVYDRMIDQKDYRKDSMKWAKLKYNLQEKRVAVLQAFQGAFDTASTQSGLDRQARMGNKTLELQLPLTELSERLAVAGAPLGEEDMQCVGRKLSFVEEDNKVTLRDFCEVVGIPLVVNQFNNVSALHPHDINKDGGIFSGSNASQVSHATNATSMMISSLEDTNLVKGNRRMKVPQKQYAHTNEPSRFWEMNHGIDETDKVVALPPSGFRGDVGHSEENIRGREIARNLNAGSKRRSYSAPVTGRKAGTQSLASALRWVGDRSLANFISTRTTDSKNSGPSFTASRLNLRGDVFPQKSGSAGVTTLKRRVRDSTPAPAPFATDI